MDELRERAVALRERRAAADADLVRRIASDVEEYRGHVGERRTPEPPEELTQRLWLMGWLIYEASWEAVQRVEPAFESLGGQRQEDSAAAYELIARTADAARGLPWPEFAPRALGAVRAQALAASKRDTPIGYDEAWILHDEARETHDNFSAAHAGVRGPKDESPGDPDHPRARYLLALDELVLQLALAETGTACRTAERVIGRWSEEVAEAGGDWTENDDALWTQKLFRQLHRGLRYGEQALEIADEIRDRHRFAAKVDEDRLALKTAYQNPGIMTARAGLLVLALCPEMERLGRDPVDGYDTWQLARKAMLARAAHAYAKIGERDEDGEPVPLNKAHQRSAVQLRLNFAIQAPGYAPAREPLFDPDLERDPLDGAALEALSGWLAEEVDGRQRGDANVIGSATMPSFIRSVEAGQVAFGAPAGYRDWRRRWPQLDRYVHESGRAERVARALDASAA
ncbi:hypothetical protein [Phytohabitans rumicis]|uniref:Uncharacterized protein n=1 Tax=Phytohabitans rumicis TaxID=1076125 RepID=A0A6V8LG76_9ACTN|nr:hypothetical protein [Phytohabitans rumicis]GFJ96243.1 hypothetical protein Prum_098850 [Phytohabitans rumicis]